MMYSGDEFYGDDETSGAFMGCEICGRYECPGECETPDEPDIEEIDVSDVGPHAGAIIIEHVGFTFDEPPY